MKDNNSVTCVGIDVSKDKLAVAVADGASGSEVLSLGTFATLPGSVDKLLKRFAVRSARMSICYEAGLTVYGPYRKVRAFGFECSVVAPSLIPVRAGDRIKTDRLDAIRLARLLRAGEMSTGIKFLGDGEWQARKHRVQGRHQWRKVHLAMDPAISDIRAVELTPSRDIDSSVLPDLLGQIPADEQIGTVTADGAYDTRRCHKAIINPQATPIIPIRKNGRLWKENCPAARARNETLRATRYCGQERWTGYHARSRIEARMRCVKAFGERIMARDPDRQTAEIHIRIVLLNRFNALGTAEIIRMA